MNLISQIGKGFLGIGGALMVRRLALFAAHEAA
jgi:hypothetical protein